MVYITFRGKRRALKNIEVKGINIKDYPDFVDSHLTYAEWGSTGVELTDEELEEVQEQHPEIAQEEAIRRSVC